MSVTWQPGCRMPEERWKRRVLKGALRKGPEAGGLMTRNMRTAGDPQLKGEGDLHPKNSFCTPSTLSSPTSCLRSRIYPPWCC